MNVFHSVKTYFMNLKVELRRNNFLMYLWLDNCSCVWVKVCSLQIPYGKCMVQYDLNVHDFSHGTCASCHLIFLRCQVRSLIPASKADQVHLFNLVHYSMVQRLKLQVQLISSRRVVLGKYLVILIIKYMQLYKASAVCNKL